MSQVIDIVSLYPKDMNIYGDSGNVLTIQRRLALYGYERACTPTIRATRGPNTST